MLARRLQPYQADTDKQVSGWHRLSGRRGTRSNPLMSVGKMLAAGNKVFFEDKNPQVVLAKGKVVPLCQAFNVFLVVGCEDWAWVLPGRAKLQGEEGDP